MKGKTAFLTGLLILVAGIILVICHKTITGSGIIITAGILFVVVGLVDILVFGSAKDDFGRPKKTGAAKVFAMMASIAAIVLGLSMLVFHGTFANLIPFIFGLLVFISALFHVYLLIWGCRPAKLPTWLWAVPVILGIDALVLFFQKSGSGTDPTIMMLTGIGLSLFGLACFVEAFLMAQLRRQIAKQPMGQYMAPQAQSNKPAVVEAPAQEIRSLDK